MTPTQTQSHNSNPIESLRGNPSFAEIAPLAGLGNPFPRFTLSSLLGVDTSDASLTLTLLSGGLWSLRASLYGREWFLDSGKELSCLMMRAMSFGELVADRVAERSVSHASL